MTDVLIIGAGSAGSVLAEQLSADPDCRVTVIEAGPGLDDPTVRSVLGDATVLPIAAGSPVVRRYRTALTRDPAADTDIVRGVCLGGSGAVNGGYFCRALPADFDDPAIPGWSWSEVEEHYRAIETDLDFPDFGGTGPIPVSRIREFSSSTSVFIAAAQQGGYRWLADLNAPETGVGAVPLNIRDGRRIGPGAAFLAPALARGNLTVLTDTTATRIRTAGGRATGVDAVGPRGPVVLDADRVVLSAGAIATAHLLMLSGIGPAGELAAHRIAVIVGSPRGPAVLGSPGMGDVDRVDSEPRPAGARGRACHRGSGDPAVHDRVRNAADRTSGWP